MSDTVRSWGTMLSAHPFTVDDIDTGSPLSARRAFDLVASLILLTLVLLPGVVIACLITLESTGPALYYQDRIGRNGRVFRLVKFRSMRIDAEAGGPCWATESDPRATRIGRIIRAFRIDEIPQLVNVLRGEMSLIGPRPERPVFAEQFMHTIPQYSERLSVAPGITGWAQVKYRYSASAEETRIKLAYDLYYIQNRSLLLDLRIVGSTVLVVLFRRGAR